MTIELESEEGINLDEVIPLDDRLFTIKETIVARERQNLEQFLAWFDNFVSDIGNDVLIPKDKVVDFILDVYIWIYPYIGNEDDGSCSSILNRYSNLSVVKVEELLILLGHLRSHANDVYNKYMNEV